MDKNLYYTVFKAAATVVARKERVNAIHRSFPCHAVGKVSHWAASAVLIFLMTFMGNGVSFAEIYYSQNYEASGVAADWTTSVGGRYTPIIVEENGNHFLSVDQTQINNNGCVLTCSSIRGKVGAGKSEFALSFDIKLTPAYDSGKPGNCSSFIVNDGGSGKVLELLSITSGSNTWKINGNSEQTLTLDATTWYSFNVEVVDTFVFLTVKDKSSGENVLLRQKVKSLISTFGLGTMVFNTSRYNAGLAIDNVKVSDKVVVNKWDFSEISANHPDKDATTYSGTVRVNGTDCDICTGDIEGLALQGAGGWIYRSAGTLMNNNKGGRMLVIPNLETGDMVVIKQNASDGYSPYNATEIGNNGEHLQIYNVTTTGNFAVGIPKNGNAINYITVLREDKPLVVYYTKGDDVEVMGDGQETEVQKNTQFVLPANTSMYKSGYSLTGWNEGEHFIACGGDTAVVDATTFTAVFAQNVVDRTDSKTVVDVPFSNISWSEAGTEKYYVAQTYFNNEKQDVGVKIDGKTLTLLDIIPGTKIAFPVGTIGDYSAADVTIAGDTLVYNGTASSLVVTYAGSAEATSFTIRFPLTQKPVISKDLLDAYAVNVNSEFQLSTSYVQAESYQWYSNTTGTVDIENDNKIAGATSATYTTPTSAIGTTYYYCVATNAFGTAISNIARVRVDDYVTFDFKNWPAGDTEIGQLFEWGDNADGVHGYYAAEKGWYSADPAAEKPQWFPQQPILYPYSLAGYMGVTIDEIGIRNGSGWTQLKRDRPFNVYDLKAGDVVVMTGFGLQAEDVFNVGDAEHGAADFDIIVNRAQTEMTLVAKTDGMMSFMICAAKTSGSNMRDANGVYTLKVPNKYAPTITTDLDGEVHTINRDETQTLMVAATANDANPLRYQWYRNEVNSNKGGVAIDGATSATYTTEPNYSYYYYCVVFNSVTGAAAVTTNTTRIQCTPKVTYVCNDPEAIGSLPPAEVITIGGQHTVEPKNQLFYKPGYTLKEWTATKISDDSVFTYNYGESYTIINDMRVEPVFVKNEKKLDVITRNTNQEWQLGTENDAPAVLWNDNTEHSLVGQFSIASETQDGAIIVTSEGFDNTTTQGAYAAVAEGTTIKIPVKTFTTVTVYAKEGETPTATFYARDMEDAEAMQANANVLTFRYDGADSLATLTLSAGNYEKIHLYHIPSGMPVIVGNLEDNYYYEVGKEYTLTVDASDGCKYQWYKNTTKATTGGTPIENATTRSLTISSDADKSEYYYMTATNDHGTVPTTCAQVDFMSYVTLDFTTWDRDDANSGMAVQDANSGAPHGESYIDMRGNEKAYPYFYPYGLAGYIAVQSTQLYIRSEGNENYFNNSGSGQRYFLIPNMKKGQHITITGDNVTPSASSDAAYTHDYRTDGWRWRNGTLVEVYSAAKYSYTFTGTDRVDIDVETDGDVLILYGRARRLFTLTMPSRFAPTLVTDLEDKYVVDKGEPLTLSVEAQLAAQIGGHSLEYQWYKNATNSNKAGTKIEGATEPSYTIEHVTEAAYYYCLVTNAGTGAITPSSPAAVGFNVDVQFVNDDPVATGEAPKTIKIPAGQPITIPVNQTLYKPGYTLTGWTDNTSTVSVGEEYIPKDNVTLYPVFTQNNASASLTARGEALTTRWSFSTANGSAEYSGNVSANVNQVTINNYTIDLGIAMTGGDNQTDENLDSRGWMKAQNANFTIPVVKNTKVYVTVYNTTGITVDGNAVAYNSEYGTTGNVEYEYTYTGMPGDITLNVGNNYLKQILVEYPAPEILTTNSNKYDVIIPNEKVSRKTAVITLTGANLEPGAEILVQKDSKASNVTIEPETISVAANGSVNQQVMVTYSQTAVQANDTTKLTFFYNNDLKPVVAVAYGRSKAYTSTTEVTPVSDKTVWDWGGTVSNIVPVYMTENDTVYAYNAYMAFSDVSLGENDAWPATVNPANLAGSGTSFASNSVKAFEGTELYFEATRKGTIEVVFSAAGNGNVTLAVNGENTTYSSSGNTKVTAVKIPVTAGGVLLQGREQGLTTGEKAMRIYKMTFIPDAETPVINLDKTTSSFTLSTTDMSLEEGNPDKETIYYTTDGTVPTRESRVYTGVVNLATNCTIRAIAMAEGKNNSDMAELVTDMTTYKLNVNVYPSAEEGRVEISPASEDGTYTENAVVTLRGYAKSGYGLLGWTTSRENIGSKTYYSRDASIDVTINGTANNYFAVFSTGEPVTVNYDISGAVYLTKDGENLIDYNARKDVEEDQAKPEEERLGYTLEGRKSYWASLIAYEYLTIQGYSTFKTPITSTSISVPSGYPLHTALYLDGSAYTLQYWQDGDGNKYDLGTRKLMTEENQSVTLYPVFKQNAYASYMDTRKSGFEVTWDFRDAYGAHPMTIPSGESGIFFDTHATMDYYNEMGELQHDQVVDVAIKINTEGVETTDDAFTNEGLPEWATLKQGTKVTLPSSYGAKFTIATYGKLNADAGGTTINGKHPDNIHEENIEKTSDGAYLYTWTMETDDREAELVVGNDYSYYKYINAVFDDADMMYLKYSSNNNEMGVVTAMQVDNEDHNPTETDLGYPYPKNSKVKLTAERNEYYRLLYWQDADDAKIYPDGTYVLANGSTGTISNTGTLINDITYMGCTDEQDKKYTVTFTMSHFHSLQAVFGDTISYYVNFTNGDGDGLALPQQRIEKGGYLIMPETNYNLYLEGYTLKYYVEVGNEEGAHYEFGHSYSVNHDMRLKPVFVRNAKSIDDITNVDGVTATWDMSLMNFDYSFATGRVVAQLPIDADNVIDVCAYIDAKQSARKAYTTDGYAVFTKDAFIQLSSTISSTIAVSATAGNTFESKQMTIKQITIDDKLSDAGATVKIDCSITSDSTKILFNDETRIKSFSITYRPVPTDKRLSLKSVTINKFYNLTEAELETLKSTLNLNYSHPASEVYEANDVMPTVAAVADEGGVITVAQATVDNATATIRLKKNGVLIKMYSINFTLTGKEAPKLDSLKVNGIVADTLKVNNEVVENHMTVASDQTVNGTIRLVFDHAMQAADVVSGADALNQTLACQVSGRSMMLTYWNLNGGETYTLNIPANTFTDVYGEKYASPINVTFTTAATSTNVASRFFDYVVTHKLNWDPKTQVVSDTIQLVSDDVIENLKKLTIKYGTLEAALDSANNAGGSERFYIFVPDGEYNMKGNTGLTGGEIGPTNYGKDDNGNFSTSVAIDVTSYDNNSMYYTGRSVLKRSNVSIIGQSQGKTVVYNDPRLCNGTLSATMRIDRDITDTYLQDLTIENRFCDSQGGNTNTGIDKDHGGAPAFYDNGCHTIAKNVTMKGHEGTYTSVAFENSSKVETYKKTDNYYEDCALWGSFRFLYDNGQAWWERPTIVLRQYNKASVIACLEHQQAPQPWGHVFNNGKVVAENAAVKNRQNNAFALASAIRNSPALTYKNMEFDVIPSAKGYALYQTGAVCRFHEYGSKNSSGLALDLSQRSLSALSPASGSDECVLSAEDAAEYTLSNVLRGDGAYDPTIYTKQVSMENCYLRNSTNDNGDCLLTWDPVEGALCYFAFIVDKATNDTLFYTIATDASFKPSASQAGSYFIIRAANERGGLGAPSAAVQYELLDEYEVTVRPVGSVTGKGWSTVCLPENTTFNAEQEGNSITVYAAITANNTTLGLKKVKPSDNLKAGCGYVIYADAPATYVFKGTHRDVARQQGAIYSILDGNPEDHAVSVGALNIYTLAYKSDISSDPGFYKFVGTQIPARKAYLSVEHAGELGFNIQDLGAKGMRVVFMGEDEFEDDITGLDGVSEDADDSKNFVFDLSGKRIPRSQMRKGIIYVIDGEKVLWSGE